MEIYVSQFVLFLLIFLRATAMVMTAPLVGHQAVPVQIKLALGAFLAFVLYSFVSHRAPTIDLSLYSTVIMALQEVLVGILIGFSSGLVFAGVYVAGDMIGFDMGLTFANIFDPENAQQMPVLSEFLYMVAMLVYLSVNGHHFFLEAMEVSYQKVPLGGFTLSPAPAVPLAHLAGVMFAIGIKIAAPVIVAGFLTNVALAILARVMPQINLFSLMFPLKIGIGLLVLAGTAPLMVFAFKKMLVGFEHNVLDLIQAL